jgi:cobalt/nickel transport system permease protein
LRHLVLERWSRGDSVIHRRDPRAKLAALAAFLLVLATASYSIPRLAAGLFLLLLLILLLARLPLIDLLLRAGVVLLLTCLLAASAWLAGEPARALSLILKSYLSAIAVLLLVATTPMPILLRGLETSGFPRFFLMVIQFLYRYLFVIGEEAGHMRDAALARGASVRALHYGAAAGALAALFARSYQRAAEIHRSMVARGFTGRLPVSRGLHFGAADALFLTCGVIAPVLIRILSEQFA